MTARWEWIRMSEHETKRIVTEFEQRAIDAEFAEIAKATKAVRSVRAAQIFAEREEARKAADLELFAVVGQLGVDPTPEEVLEVNARIKHLKDAKPLEVQRRWYVPGAKFRIVKEGARLEALVFFGDTNWAGWSRNLRVGELVELVDWRRGWNADEPVPQFAAAERMPHGDARWITIAPTAGLWRPYPHPGFLEPYDEGDDA